MCTCVYGYVRVWVCACMGMCVYGYVRVWVCACMGMCVSVYVFYFTIIIYIGKHKYVLSVFFL